VRRLGLVLLFLVAACSSNGEGEFYVRASGLMPAISGPTLEGGRLDPADYRGKVVVVNFWNQDCPPCRQEMPLLEQEARRLNGAGVVVIGVVYVGGNWPNDPEAARDFLDRLDITYPNLVDESSELARRFGIAGIPSSVVADREGKMRFRVLGKLRPGQLDELISMLEED
jgi:thiol-disulfide isomerase/thioredoxin